jgi:hypothetical protein
VWPPPPPRIVYMQAASILRRPAASSLCCSAAAGAVAHVAVPAPCPHTAGVQGTQCRRNPQPPRRRRPARHWQQVCHDFSPSPRPAGCPPTAGRCCAGPAFHRRSLPRGCLCPRGRGVGRHACRCCANSPALRVLCSGRVDAVQQVPGTATWCDKEGWPVQACHRSRL